MRSSLDKLKPILADLNKLSNVVDEVVEKAVYNKFFTKDNANDSKMPSTSGLVTKTQYDSSKQSLEIKIEVVDKTIPDTIGLVKKTDYNTKNTETENKIPTVTGLVTTAALNTKDTEMENKIPDNTNLATKVALNTKATIQRLKVKYLTLLIWIPKLL